MQKHYSPQISRTLVSNLYHEAKRRRMPMTKLVDTLLRNALTGSQDWSTSDTARVAEDSPSVTTSEATLSTA